MSVEFSRQEYWSGLLFLSPGDLPNPGIKPKSPALAGGFFTAEPPGNPVLSICLCVPAKSLQLCQTLWDPIPGSLCPWDSPGKNTGVGCHAFLQGIFLIQGLNWHLLGL